MKTLVLVYLIIMSGLAHAGWTSGGGGLLKDAHNPWFLNNTSEVKYCIKIDEANFGQKLSQVSEAVKRSLDFWKRNFKTANASTIPPIGTIILAQQNFVETNCDFKQDITFQFGVLDGQQFKYFKNPTQYVAAAIRTQYDRVNMKGKGFIYVSPEAGTLALNSKNVIKYPWSSHDGALLVPILIHELGHIFGLQHNHLISFMEEDFPERLLSTSQYNYEKSMWDYVIKKDLDKVMNVFKFDSSLIVLGTLICNSQSPSSSSSYYLKHRINNYNPSRLLEFFNIKENEKCYSLKIENDKLNVYTGSDENSLILIGQAELKRNDSFFKEESITQMYIPSEQKVYNLKSFENTRHTLTFIQTQTDFKGLYKSLDGVIQRQLTVSISPMGLMTVGGSLDEIWYLDLVEGF